MAQKWLPNLFVFPLLTLAFSRANPLSPSSTQRRPLQRWPAATPSLQMPPLPLLLVACKQPDIAPTPALVLPPNTAPSSSHHLQAAASPRHRPIPTGSYDIAPTPALDLWFSPTPPCLATSLVLPFDAALVLRCSLLDCSSFSSTLKT